MRVRRIWHSRAARSALHDPGRVHPLRPTRSSESADNVTEVHTVNAFAQAPNDTWKLKLQDRTAQDTGCISS
ncbi:MAG: hypothetical protein WCD21_42710 [Streptomyces sp.]